MASKSDTIHQLKITLDNIDPPIWRRVQVASDISLYKLHDAIQVLFGWNGGHMHQFIVGEDFYGEKTLDRAMKSERTAKLSLIAPAPKSKLQYEYDFGDGWMHTIVVEKILPTEPGVKYPRCTAGKRNAPPDDIGGPFAYPDFLAAITDPSHEQHAELLEWVGKDFNPERFALAGINHMLRGYMPYKTWVPIGVR